MVKQSLFRSAAFAALAIVGALAVPAQAQDVDRTTARAERQAQRAEARDERQQHRAERQTQRAAAPQAARQPRSAPDTARRAQRAERQAQRAGDGQRFGRAWNDGRAASRPERARRAEAPNVSQRGGDAMRNWRRDDGPNWSGERNRSYADRDRNRTYRDGVRDGRRADRREDRVDNRQAYRNGYRAGTRADSWRDRRDQSNAYRNGYASGSRDYRRWDRNDWRRDRRYNWHGYRSQHRDLYRAGRYYSPYRSWSYNRLSIGFFLQPLFYGNRYWINDPWQYRLPEVYGPYRWVRYYDDVLLVDIYTGEVVDVIHDFFW